jgi:hypothetical protein
MARVTISPVNLTSLSTGSFLAGSAVGCDATGTGTAFASWSSLGSPLGVQWINNGYSFLVVTNGATATAADILVGRKSGGGLLPVFNAETVIIGASPTLPIWLGPYSVQDFTQQDASQYASALSPAGVIGTTGVGMTCVDFTNTTTLTVRLYQLIPALP